jgi:cell wall-associated NlpC family hydrolase
VPTEQEQRAAVVAEALTWRGTPFHNPPFHGGAAIKGVGTDCAYFVAAVYHLAGVLPVMQIAPYSPQHMLHRDQELFLGYVERVAHEIAADRLQPADLVLYRVGRVFAHAAIVVDWPKSIIHAFKPSGCVRISGPSDGLLRGKAMRAFSFWGR